MRDCNQLRAGLREFAAGELPDARSALVRVHLSGCAACRQEFARERALVDALQALPAGPHVVDIAPPPLPSRRVLLTTGRAAVAVALAAAATVLLVVRLVGHAGDTRPDAADAALESHGATGVGDVGDVRGGRVRIRSIVDAPDLAPPAEDGLLALTAGVEAVVMRRPAERR